MTAGNSNRIITEEQEIGSMPRSHQSRNADCSAIPGDPRLARVADELATLFRPSIRLIAESGTVQLPVGATRLGGRPDLPPDMPWPSCRIEMPVPSEAFLKARPRERRAPENGIVHLAFVGQINLRDVDEFDTESLLPPSGLLSFFYNPQIFASDMGTGPAQVRDNLSGFSYNVYGYDNIKNWQVIYHGPDAELVPRDFPPTLHEGIRYGRKTVRLSTERTLPSLETSFLPKPNSDEGRAKLTNDEWQAYGELRYGLRANIEQLDGLEDACCSSCLSREINVVCVGLFLAAFGC